jgi:hypothetical protein
MAPTPLPVSPPQPAVTPPTRADRDFLLHLQRLALTYFLDNQTTLGLILDRQSNHGPPRSQGICSTAATGMGFIALALASATPYRLLTRAEAVQRIRTGLQAVLGLPHDQGIVAHFIDATGAAWGIDTCSTVETSWLVAGALWAAAFLRDSELETLATRLFERIDWQYWTAPELPGGGALLRHGKDRHGRFLAGCWDRLNGETLFMYVLATGAAEGRAWSPQCWSALQPCYGTVAGMRFNNADLGLFVFQYGLDLLDLQTWHSPGLVDLCREAQVAVRANHRHCQSLADTFVTYRRYWGLSAGDGPGQPPERDTYRAYAPTGPVDGTAHLTATLASVAQAPDLVLENLRQAQHERQLHARGRYGFSPINVDHGWVGRDMIGIDAGAAVLALDNYLANNRVRTDFQNLPWIQRGMRRLGFYQTAAPAQAA